MLFVHMCWSGMFYNFFFIFFSFPFFFFSGFQMWRDCMGSEFELWLSETSKNLSSGLNILTLEVICNTQWQIWCDWILTSRMIAVSSACLLDYSSLSTVEEAPTELFIFHSRQCLTVLPLLAAPGGRQKPWLSPSPSILRWIDKMLLLFNYLFPIFYVNLHRHVLLNVAANTSSFSLAFPRRMWYSKFKQQIFSSFIDCCRQRSCELKTRRSMPWKAPP